MWAKILDRLRNDFHIPVALIVFAVTTGYHFYTGHDLGSQYCNSLYAFYAFLGGHSFVNRTQNDNPNQPQ
jgi:hypothetical protein